MCIHQVTQAPGRWVRMRVCLQVVGASLLLSWDVEVARKALALFEKEAAANLSGGYIVSAMCMAQALCPSQTCTA